jgi:hypothetical protein
LCSNALNAAGAASAATACQPYCLAEIAKWLGSSNGLLADLESMLREPTDAVPYNPSENFFHDSKEETPFNSFMYPPSKTMHLTLRDPSVNLKIEVPMFANKNFTYWNRVATHLLVPIRQVNDEIRWRMYLLYPQAATSGRDLKREEAAQFLATLLSQRLGTSLRLTIRVSKHDLREVFEYQEEMWAWWRQFRKMRLERNGLQWFPPTNTTVTPSSASRLKVFTPTLYFRATRRHPFEWNINLSLQHLLLFWLFRARESNPLIEPETHTRTFTRLPLPVSNFLQQWDSLSEKYAF